MLLKQLAVDNGRGSVLNLPLDDISAGFLVREIGGLDPVKATLVSSSFANADGAQYHSSRRDPRNITLKLGLKPDYAHGSVKDLRDILYSYFMPKTAVTMKFHMFDKFAVSVFLEDLDLQIAARIESFESSLFSNDPEVNISLMCFDPDFIDPEMVTVDGSTVSDLTESIVSYVGTVDAGVVFTLLPDRDISEFTIFHRPPDETLRTIDFSLPLVADDILKINSNVGSKGVSLTHLGVETSVVYAVSPQSSWLSLLPGNNNLRVYAGGDPIPYTLEYYNKYGGL